MARHLGDVSRALKIIEGGALDDGDMASLADRLEIGERQLRRLFRQHVGPPRSRRPDAPRPVARQLIHQTELSMIQVALASGFGSVRRFNETFQHLYLRPPGELGAARRGIDDPAISLLLPYGPPTTGRDASIPGSSGDCGVERIDGRRL